MYILGNTSDFCTPPPNLRDIIIGGNQQVSFWEFPNSCKEMWLIEVDCVSEKSGTI